MGGGGGDRKDLFYFLACNARHCTSNCRSQLEALADERKDALESQQ